MDYIGLSYNPFKFQRSLLHMLIRTWSDAYLWPIHVFLYKYYNRPVLSLSIDIFQFICSAILLNLLRATLFRFHQFSIPYMHLKCVFFSYFFSRVGIYFTRQYNVVYKILAYTSRWRFSTPRFEKYITCHRKNCLVLSVPVGYVIFHRGCLTRSKHTHKKKSKYNTT